MAWKLKDLERTLLIGSTLVEGSTLTEKEAIDVLAGQTVQGHSVSEIRELLNYRASVEWLITQLEKSPYLSQDLILTFHKKLFQGFSGKFGVWKSQLNFTYLSNGARHNYLAPNKVKNAMSDWIDRFNTSESYSKNEAQTAAEIYYDFQQIHPFEDGNGRIGRILIAYWLHWHYQMGFRFVFKDKIPHLRALEAANHGDFSELTAFFKKRITKNKK